LRFGTDGVRGPANSELTPEFALRFGRAAARAIDVPRWFIVRDTRRSGPMLAAAVAAGLASEGVEVVDVGVASTPVGALLARPTDTAAVVVSASHNPWQDNGLKLFGPGGHKLSDETQVRIEEILMALDSEPPSLDPAAVGEIVGGVGLVSHYADAVVEAVGSSGQVLAGLHVVLDCGHGAASAIAPGIFRRLGARVTSQHVSPDGRNINNGVGSTDPAPLAAKVIASGADLGLAFDGDADRVIAVDESGTIVDGDRLLCLFALDMSARGLLAHNTLVVTVMSNLGLHRAMTAKGVTVEVTAVGDRHVLEAMSAGGFSLGGEQSGHLIFADIATTGDGILAGAMLCDLIVRANSSLSRIAGQVMHRVPQVLVNTPTSIRPDDPAADLAQLIASLQSRLGEDGRILVRSSGTEPLVRVMVEALDVENARLIADELTSAVLSRYGAGPAT